MNNSAIYDRFIDMFLHSADDFEPYGAIAPEMRAPQCVERRWGEDAGDAEALMMNGGQTDY